MWQRMLAAVFLLCLPARALDNGLARRPPLGWNTWNAFGCDTHEDTVKELVNIFVASGLRDAGYTYFNLDDCWSIPWRSEEGKLQADPHRFPSGMKALADYVHSKGLQFGIYADAGLFTCAARAGSMGHEKVDAQTFADWGVDYLKYDNCGVPPGLDVQQRYTAMRDALNATGRPIVFSMCEWGLDQPEQWSGAVGNSWRTSPDISKSWQSVLYNLDSVIGLSVHAGPGAWNDPDMLQVGNSYDLMHHGRERIHFGLWALLKAPLLIGADLRNIRRKSLELLKNPGVLAINQDSMGVAGDLLVTHGSQQVFGAPLSAGRRAVALVNRQPLGSPVSMTLLWSKIGYPVSLQVKVEDAFTGSVLSAAAEHNMTFRVPPGDIVMVVLQPLQEQLCGSKQRSGALDASVLVPGQSTLKALRSRVLRDPYQVDKPGEDCVRLSTLDTWRPWHHGFFDLEVKHGS